MAMSKATLLNLTPDLHPGYRLSRLRGRGGFGEVWEAETTAGDIVALKFLRCTGNRSTTRELRSIQLVQGLSHPHITQIKSVWCVGSYLMVAMELADGSLTDLLDIYLKEVGTPLPPDHLLPWLSQAAEALDFLNNRQHRVHEQLVTVQHCDINPSNILLFGQTIKLSDFGLTSTLGARQQVHQRAGTLAYAAPEVFQGSLSNRTDQYALAVCYCLLRGGCFPFTDTPEDFSTDYTRPAPDLSMLTPAEQPIVARALTRMPQGRWASCGELISELQRVTPAPASAKPKPATGTPRGTK